MRLRRRAAPRLLLAAVALLLTACSGGGAAPAQPEGDPLLRLLGGIPAEEAARGVYIVRLDAAGEQSPGSRIAPFLGQVLESATYLVETTAPPLTLLGGVPAAVDTPEHATRVEDVLVFADAPLRDAAAGLLNDAAVPGPELTMAAAAGEPVVWAGPTPSTGARGRSLITLDEDHVTFTVTPTMDVQDAVDFARNQLANAAPPGSPGKQWSSIVGEASVEADGGRVVISGVPRDLPGPLLRGLIDQQQLTFLPG